MGSCTALFMYERSSDQSPVLNKWKGLLQGHSKCAGSRQFCHRLHTMIYQVLVHSNFPERHYTLGNFLATCLAIRINHFLTNMSRNFLLLQPLVRSRLWFYFVQLWLKQKLCKTCSFQGMLVTLRNNLCNLCHNGATRLRDKLQEKLPGVTVPQDPFALSSFCPLLLLCWILLQNWTFWEGCTPMNHKWINPYRPYLILIPNVSSSCSLGW